MSRCPWALIKRGMGTRCFKEESHVNDPNRSTHVGRSWEVMPLLNATTTEIRWLAGDPREQMTSREDLYAWEIKDEEKPFNWEDIPEVSGDG